MKKVLTYILLATALAFTNAGTVMAQTPEFYPSATLKSGNDQYDFDYRVVNLENFLAKYNSPLKDYAGEFVYWADTYNIDYRLVPAITGVESTFGKRIPQNSYNAYGWANGDYSFKSWQESIATVSGTLKTKYMDKGADTIPEIARIYAPPSSTWAGKVKYFMGKIDSVPVQYDL